MKVSFVTSILPLLNMAFAIYIPTDSRNLAHISDYAKEVTKSGGLISDSFKKALAPFVTSEVARQNIIADSYIVVFKDEVEEDLVTQHLSWVKETHYYHVGSLEKHDSQHPFLISSINKVGNDFIHGLKHVFNISNRFKGYSGKFLPETIEAIRQDELVKYVEHDSRVFASNSTADNDAPWGLGRIAHRDQLNLTTFNKYLYDDQGGKGVTAYVIDTGINTQHIDFGGRASWGKTIPINDTDSDGNGHGTHCSGTVGGSKFGVAKNVSIVAVKVLNSNGSGDMSDVIKGVEWTVRSHLDAVSQNKKEFKGSVANMSLGGGQSTALDTAVNVAVLAGVHFAVAAGNNNADACKYSPAAAADAVTVGASDISDTRASFSNFGKCVDIFGPGVNIQSTYIGSKYALSTLSGTSMASPHVAGLLAYYLSLVPSSDSEYSVSTFVTPAQLKSNLIAFASGGKLSDLPLETPNLLAFNGAGQNLTGFWNPPSALDVPVKQEFYVLLQEEKELVEELEKTAKDITFFVEYLRRKFVW